MKTEAHDIHYASSLIEASLDPLIAISLKGKITDLNQAKVDVTGIEREKLIGSDFIDYFTEPLKAHDLYREVFSKGSVTNSPLTFRHKSGKLTNVLFNGSVYKNDTGKVMGAVVMARDISKQRWATDLQADNKELAFQNSEKEKHAAELRLDSYARSLIEASLDPLFTINLKGKITDINNASVNITGVSRENLIGSDFFKYFTEPKKARKVYKEVFANGFVTDYPLTILDGKLTDVLFNGSVYKDESGTVRGVVVVARDMTYQKIIASELREAIVFAELAVETAGEAKTKAEGATLIAENAVKAKQQFLSNMSHEIRTPMNAIIGFTKVLLKTEMSEKQQEYLTAIKLSGDSLIVLINDILDLAKVDSGKMIFEKITFSMALSISGMVHLFEAKLQEKNVELVSKYDKNIPDVLVGDPVRLHQIIMNLLSNAVKFTNKGKITLSVRLVEEDDLSATVEFTVADTGIGIAENKLEKIFENFQQASSGTARLYGGTGLGLAIVKQLVEAQGGRVGVISEVDKGSEFSFVLNYLKTNAETELITDAVELDKRIKNLKVLVVEDIALNQLLMKTLLDEFGFECDIAPNGKVAIEKLKSNSYDIILMDLQMPEMNGFEATEYIRNQMNSKIPIIAITADVTTVDLAKCKAVGMNDYISKPVDERILYVRIVGLVTRPIVSNEIEKKDKDKNKVIAESKKLKCTDLKYLYSRTKSNPVLIMEMISLYLEQTPVLVREMKRSFLDNDWISLQSAAHKIIPSFAIMGISQDYENMARTVQEYAVIQKQSDGMHEIVLQIEAVCVQACKELKSEFNRIKKMHK